jgi:hypothetical protein
MHLLYHSTKRLDHINSRPALVPHRNYPLCHHFIELAITIYNSAMPSASFCVLFCDIVSSYTTSIFIESEVIVSLPAVFTSDICIYHRMVGWQVAELQLI